MSDIMETTPVFDVLPAALSETLTVALEYAALIIDMCGIALILIGFTISLLRGIGQMRHGLGLTRPLADLRKVREQLGVYILFGLELMIASDIIHTAISRNLSDLIEVGALVLIRTAIGFFLGREVKEVEESSQ